MCISNKAGYTLQVSGVVLEPDLLQFPSVLFVQAASGLHQARRPQAVPCSRRQASSWRIIHRQRIGHAGVSQLWGPPVIFLDGDRYHSYLSDVSRCV